MTKEYKPRKPKLRGRAKRYSKAAREHRMAERERRGVVETDRRGKITRANTDAYIEEL